MNMTAREAIERLNDLAEHLQDTWNPPYIDAIDMAVAALEAQIPRVLTLNEVIEYLDNANPVALQIVKMGGFVWCGNGDEIYCSLSRVCKCDDIDKNYGVKWRCWNVKPTAEQTQNTPWCEA